MDRHLALCTTDWKMLFCLTFVLQTNKSMLRLAPLEELGTSGNTNQVLKSVFC